MGEFTRENLTLEVEHNITSEQVIDYLAKLLATRGLPKHIRSDNGPQFIAQAIQDWLGQLEVETLYIEPGSQVLGRTPTRRALSVGFVMNSWH
ncbi:MAG TPA: DDE-type integrase/transposase/recombinase [Pirellulaceae bacterium]|nr:DDE-type integrase/transposase/recombinase [Pirellulaceae bacterium]